MCLPTFARRSSNLLEVLSIIRHFSSSNYYFSFHPEQTTKLRRNHNPDILNFDPRPINVKITSLCRCRKIKEARKLFDEMPQRDAFSYASMITVYLKNGDLQKAEKLFQEMPERNVVAQSAMIDGYAKAGWIDEARRVFDEMPERNVFSWTSLISGYLRIGQVCEARWLFNQMPIKNVHSWTAMVLGYARNGLIAEAREIFDQMPEKNVVSWTSMIKSYVDNGMVDDARKLFDEMPHRNLYSWNTMILGCLDDGQTAQAIQLFELMPQRNVISWTTMVTGLSRNGSIEIAREFFDRMPQKDIAAWNAMITACADDGRMIEASELFNSMPERNVVTWNAMIDGYAKNGPEKEAMIHLVHMLRSSNRPNETTFTSVLTACEGGSEVTQAHAHVILLGFESDTSLTNALITMYSRSGDVGSAQFAFERLMGKDIVSWTAMILAYSNHGCGNRTLCIFARMLRAGAEPDGVTFIGVLSACSRAGLVKKGKLIFSSMSRAYGLEPKAEHYSCLVDLLGRAGLVDEAKTVVSRMPPSERDGAVLGALLGACKLHGDVEAAAQVGEELIKLEPGGSGAYMLLANVHAGRGKWDDMALVRKKMKERKVRKVPGFSQIEVKNRYHVFFVGDRAHPQVKEIYEMLEQVLLPQMKDRRYLQMVPSFTFKN
ncbi:pentatricopeptide repeat-containing protein At4g02750-like [Magnolia sinica]|uniref:pentatricopeptide repeat-containing protein At4g02750-like n=1 Tax=Magnolia sinica TaxID=86752 RepID=UPI00265B1718|nr:pentatricopeptide repeat-containing protein At4g02750-like [Magnolia sinica]